jgi:hypothetical protein
VRNKYNFAARAALLVIRSLVLRDFTHFLLANFGANR